MVTFSGYLPTSVAWTTCSINLQLLASPRSWFDFFSQWTHDHLIPLDRVPIVPSSKDCTETLFVSTIAALTIVSLQFASNDQDFCDRRLMIIHSRSWPNDSASQDWDEPAFIPMITTQARGNIPRSWTLQNDHPILSRLLKPYTGHFSNKTPSEIMKYS